MVSRGLVLTLHYGLLASLCILILLDLPRVLALPAQLYLPVGLLGRLECPVTSNPAITKVVWSRNGQSLKTYDNPRLKITKQVSYEFWS